MLLKEYIQRGSLMRLNKSKELLEMEDLVKNCDQSKIVKSGLKYYSSCPLTDEFVIALAAPSMTGKTQLAFSVESKLPLYFVFASSQSVYSNFTELTSELYRFAISDVKMIPDERSIGDTLITDKEIITLSHLKSNTHTRFKTLGFLLAVMTDAENRNCNFTMETWMEYHSNRIVNLPDQIEPISIIELMKDSKYEQMINKYYVFIDEFYASPELIFIRNLCRGIGLTCVLSSTNPKVANLIGSSPSFGSGGELPGIWSVVIPKLPPVPVEIFEHFGLEKVLAKLIDLASIEERSKMTKLCEYLKSQCQKSRPGVSKFILESINQIILKNETLDVSLKVDDFFTAFLHNLTFLISCRKSLAFDSPKGISSNLKLLNGHVFDKVYARQSSKTGPAHMIDNHFYNLKNPYNQDQKPFLLFRKVGNSIPLVITDPFENEPFSFQCFFDQEEELLLLSCLIAELRRNVFNSFFGLEKEQDRAESENVLAKIHSGNALEVTTLESVIDSSHYTDEEIKGSFKGVPLNNFFRNFINNLNPKCSILRSERKVLKFKYGKEFDNVMESIKVPFLYPANNNWPEIYNELFHPSSSSFRLGTYCRASNDDQIDAQFDLVGSNNEKLLAVIECKNRKKPISVSLLMEILEKAQKYEDNVFLHMIMCRSCSKFKDSSVFTGFLKSRKINVYRLKVSDSSSEDEEGGEEEEFELVPISKTHSDPKIISIVFETNVIYGLDKKMLKLRKQNIK